MLSCTRGSHGKKNATGTPKHRRSLRNGLRLIRGHLGAPGFLATVASRETYARRLIPASGDRDITISLVRDGIARQSMPPASIAPRANVRDGRDAPLSERGMGGPYTRPDILKNGIFFPDRLAPSGKSDVTARRALSPHERRHAG